MIVVATPESAEWREYMAQALMAQFVALPKPMRLDDEQIPGRDDLNEGENE